MGIGKKHIAVLGTGSDVGKSIIAAAICRALSDQGEAVAPFKSQNMSNNSGITPEGLEMGRAQIVQAEAARIVPHVDMNPILLKPTGDKKSQVVLNGRVHGNHTAMDYHRNKGFYFKEACSAFDRLAASHDRIILEGAGSCAEVNLMANDIVNFAMAEYAGADVILAADIHRGGVFAQLVGTMACLPQKYRSRVKGFIINRFRGDIALFHEGKTWIENKTGLPVFGVLPWYDHFRIDAEDSVEIETCPQGPLADGVPAIAVVRLPRIANFTDFHALFQIPDIQVRFVDKPENLDAFQAVIIPGSKNTRQDLSWLKTHFGKALSAYKGHILGICGGYQMLGSWVEDPEGLEGPPGRSEGLGLLPVETVLKAPKTTTLSSFSWNGAQGRGYEIHMGFTRITDGTPLLRVASRNQAPCEDVDGCLSPDRSVAGTYMHGFFDEPGITANWLSTAGICSEAVRSMPSMGQQKERDYDLLKTHFQAHVDLDSIYQG